MMESGKAVTGNECIRKHMIFQSKEVSISVC